MEREKKNPPKMAREKTGKNSSYTFQMKKINGSQVWGVLFFNCLSNVLWILFIRKLWGQQSRKRESIIRAGG